MFRYDRLNELVKETGVKKAHICREIDKSPYYLRDAEKNNIDIKGESLNTIAKILGTSPAYLTGISNEKKPTPDVEGRLDEEEQELIDLFRGFNRDGQLALLNMARGFVAGGLYIKRGVSGLAKDA